MIQWKKDNLPTRQEKEAAAKKQQEHEQLPTVWLKWKMPCVSRTQPTRSVWPTSKPRGVSWTQR